MIESAIGKFGKRRWIARPWTTLSVVVLSAASAPAWCATGRWTGGGPEGGHVRTLWVDAPAARIYAGALSNGVWYSEDGGATWEATAVGPVHVMSLFQASGGKLFALTSNGQLWWTTDGGASWEPGGSGLEGLGTWMVAGVPPD